MKNFSQFNLFLAIFIVVVLVIFNFTFRTPLLLGFIFSALTFPIFSKFALRINKTLPKFANNLAAILTIVFISTILVVVLNIFVNQLTGEFRGGNFTNLANNFLQELPKNETLVNNFGQETVNNLSSTGQSQITEWTNKLNSPTQRTLLLQSFFASDKLDQTLNVGKTAINIGQTTLNTLFNFSVNLIIFLLSWFFGLISGQKWLLSIFRLLPLDLEEQDEIKKDLKLGINNVIYANLLSGIIHTVLCILIMVIFQVPNIFIFSFLIFMIGVLPLSPSELGYAIPILIIAQSNPLAALILAILAEIVVLFANYVFLPRVIVAGSEGNPLLILTSVMAGISIFGIMGFVIGPVLMILVQTLYQILVRRETKEEDLDNTKLDNLEKDSQQNSDQNSQIDKIQKTNSHEISQTNSTQLTKIAEYNKMEIS